MDGVNEQTPQTPQETKNLIEINTGNWLRTNPGVLLSMVVSDSQQGGADYEQIQRVGFVPAGKTLDSVRQDLSAAPVLQQEGKDRVVDLSQSDITSLMRLQGKDILEPRKGRGLQITSNTLMEVAQTDRDAAKTLSSLKGFRADAMLVALYAAGVDSTAIRNAHGMTPREIEVRYPHDNREEVSIVKMKTDFAGELVRLFEDGKIDLTGIL